MRLNTFLLAAKLLLLVPFSAFAQASQQTQRTQLNPFQVSIINGGYDYMAHRILITLTNKELEVFDQTGMTEMRDSLLFSRVLPPSETLFQISKADFDQLKYSYLNPCVEKGSQISVSITKNGKCKRVYLRNYYQPDVGNFLSLVNTLIPEKYRIWYDKEKLEAENCTGYESGEAIQLFDSASGTFLRLDSTHTSVSAIGKNGLIIWKTDLDSSLWCDDIFWQRGKNDSIMRKENSMKESRRPQITYFGLIKQNENSSSRSPDGSAVIEIGMEGIASEVLDVKNGKLLWSARD